MFFIQFSSISRSLLVPLLNIILICLLMEESREAKKRCCSSSVRSGYN